jgi:hypothetical protein
VQERIERLEQAIREAVADWALAPVTRLNWRRILDQIRNQSGIGLPGQSGKPAKAKRA